MVSRVAYSSLSSHLNGMYFSSFLVKSHLHSILASLYFSSKYSFPFYMTQGTNSMVLHLWKSLFVGGQSSNHQNTFSNSIRLNHLVVQVLLHLFSFFILLSISWHWNSDHSNPSPLLVLLD